MFLNEEKCEENEHRYLFILRQVSESLFVAFMHW